MSTLLIRLISLVLFAALCAVTTYWVILLAGRNHVVAASTQPATAPSTDAAGGLFGGKPTTGPRQDYKVVGILSLGPGQGAAAIIGSSQGAIHTIAAGQQLDGDTRLAEVREHSIVLERAGVKSEIFLPVPATSSGYLR
ncbi:MAG: hypothetical protein ABSF50_23160 [Burkholderiaceae bacterium]|jgi:general secretion pathway protein C